MNKKKFFCVIAVFMAILLFVVSTGGCGGSSGSDLQNGVVNNNPNGDPGTPNTNPENPNGDPNGDPGTDNPPTVNDIATRPTTPLAIGSVTNVMDSDGNGKPDFLDFAGVPQYHPDTNVEVTNFRASVSAASTLADAAELSLAVPSMVWFKELKPQSAPNVFAVALEAGKTYTVEFSKNFTEPLGAILPDIKIYDPENAAIDQDAAEEEAEESEDDTDDDSEPIDNSPKELDVDIVTYPVEHPSVICYTFTPAVTGNYIIRVADAEPSTINLEVEDADDEDTYNVDTASVLFIYEERYNDAGEAGYYTKFKFLDANGKETSAVSMRDIIQLRKEFLKVNPDYFNTVYGYDLEDDEYGAGETEGYDINEASNDDYINFLNIVQTRLGLVDAEDEDQDTYGDADEDTYGESVYDPTIKVLPPLGGNRSEIPATVTGIPYDDTYELGNGFSAITNLSPVGGIQGLDDFEDKLRNNIDNGALTTEYYASFVSTREEAEGMTKTNANVSLSKNALGASYSTGSTNNYKFGLTATNLVIHYEVRETKYRKLKNAELEQMLREHKYSNATVKTFSQDQIYVPAQGETNLGGDDDDDDDDDYGASLKAADDERSILEVMQGMQPDNFRLQFGDYFVAGYQYGACFDAYISIATQTSEQLDEVKHKLGVSATYNGITGSADVANETKNILKNSGAQVTVRIVTNGMGHKPIEIPLTNSTDISAMDNVFSELMSFRNNLTTQMDRADFSPIRVMLKRWRSIPAIGIAFAEKGDIGDIPITPDHATKIGQFNTALVNLRAHRNFVMAIGNVKPAEKLDESFSELVSYVTHGGGNLFYSNAEAMAVALENAHALNNSFKALADRYVFYQKLVNAQAAEQKTYDGLKKNVEDSNDDKDNKYVRKMPFGTEHGGESGYESFNISSYVTADIKAGGNKISRNYNRKGFGAYRYEWQHDHKKGQEDYWKSAGPATISADALNKNENAIFCKVEVQSTATSSELDQRRELVNGAPAVGRKAVGFYFRGGRGRDVNWTIKGKPMIMNPEDYPFDGLKN